MVWKPEWARTSFKDKWARIIGIPSLAVFVFLLGDRSLSSMSSSTIFASLLRNLLYVLFYWELSRLIFLYVHHRFVSLKDTVRRIVLQVVLFLSLIMVGSVLMAFVDVTFFDHAGEEGFREEFISVGEKSLVLLGVVMLFYECAHLFRLYQKNLYETERFKKEAVLAQFNLLKSQVDPHFLFNSLNTLISLIPDDPDKSIEFVQRLSNVYRSVLNFNEERLVSLEMELRFLRDYIFLFQIRFGSSLVVSYSTTVTEEEYYIVPFTLQMLVENAIKHNVVSHSRPLYIQIVIEEQGVSVVNNLQLKTSGVVSTRMGIANIKTRYQLIGVRDVLVQDSKTTFSVSVPILSKREYENTDH